MARQEPRQQQCVLAPWHSEVDSMTRRTYYVNSQTRQSQWEPPMAAAPERMMQRWPQSSSYPLRAHRRSQEPAKPRATPGPAHVESPPIYGAPIRRFTSRSPPRRTRGDDDVRPSRCERSSQRDLCDDVPGHYGPRQHLRSEERQPGLPSLSQQQSTASLPAQPQPQEPAQPRATPSPVQMDSKKATVSQTNDGVTMVEKRETEPGEVVAVEPPTKKTKIDDAPPVELWPYIVRLICIVFPQLEGPFLKSVKQKLQVSDAIASQLFDYIKKARDDLPVAGSDKPPKRDRDEEAGSSETAGTSETASPGEPAAVLAVEPPTKKTKIDNAGAEMVTAPAKEEEKQKMKKKKKMRTPQFNIHNILWFGHRGGERLGEIVEIFDKTVTVRTSKHRELIRVDKSAELLRRQTEPQSADVDPDPVPELLSACESGDVVRVICLRRDDVDVSCRNAYGETPLHVVCTSPRLLLTDDGAMSGAMDLVKLLVEEYGADVNAADVDGKTPFLLAISERRLELARYLVARGADPEARRHDGATALHIACYPTEDKNDIDAVTFLLKECNADPTTAMLDGATPLRAAMDGECQPGDAVIDLLLECGADVDASTKDGATPLWIACRNGYLDTVVRLLAHGADVTKATNDGIMPLVIATDPVFHLDPFGHRRCSLNIKDLLTTLDGFCKGPPYTSFARIKRNKRWLAHMVRALLTHGALPGWQTHDAQHLDEAQRELQRWRDGDLIARQILDVDTGAVTTVAVPARAEDSVDDDDNKEPSTTKAPRTITPTPSSMLSQLADVHSQAVQIKTEAALETSRLRDELEDTKLCTLCMEQPRDVVFSGCGHFLACTTCADKLLAQHGGTRKRTKLPCPACRQPVKSMLSCIFV